MDFKEKLKKYEGLTIQEKLEITRKNIEKAIEKSKNALNNLSAT